MVGITQTLWHEYSFHQGIVNVIACALSRFSTGITSHEEDKKELVKDVHKIAHLWVWIMDSN